MRLPVWSMTAIRRRSLAENVVRLSMQALDQFKAFAALADQGLSVADISVFAKASCVLFDCGLLTGVKQDLSGYCADFTLESECFSYFGPVEILSFPEDGQGAGNGTFGRIEERCDGQGGGPKSAC